MGNHGIGDLDETADVGAQHIIARSTVLISCLPAAATGVVGILKPVRITNPNYTGVAA
jgi:hypothetical protein